MNNAPDRRSSPSNEVEAQLAKLEGKVSAMRAVLVQLLQEVVMVEARLDHGQASLLLKANEQLVVSALGAQMDAESALGALDEAARVGGLDALTGLPNRTVFLDRFERAISHAKRHGNCVALLFLDLDSFKQVNDTFGHAAGDRTLRLVADCLTSLVRETDTVSRHGGDEFLVLLAEVTNAADASVVAAKVNAELASYSRFDNQPLPLRASIGISVYPEDGLDAGTLIACADSAMYLAKKQKRGRAHAVGEPSLGLAPAAPHELHQRPRAQPEFVNFEQAHRERGICATPTRASSWPRSARRICLRRQRRYGADTRNFSPWSPRS